MTWHNPSAPLIRHLSKLYGSGTGQHFQKIPLFLLPEDVRVLTAHTRALLENVGDGDALLHAPYDDVLLDFPSGLWAFLNLASKEHPGLPVFPDRGALWVRVRP